MTTPPPPKRPNFPYAPSGQTTRRNPSPETADEEARPLPPAPPAQDVSRVPLDQTDERIPLADTQRLRPEGRQRRSTGEDLPVPPRIGPYTVLERIASGGMGSVWLGEDEALGRFVALKLMAGTLHNDEDARQRFKREARATAAIDHVNVARVYMVGETDNGIPFLAMEYVDGGTVEQIIRERLRLPWSQVADLTMQAAEGLRAAWKQGVIHRDIKPPNLMLSEASEGGTLRVKLVDFGLARVMGDEGWRTTAGMVMGTPRYMSPEQAQGREADFRADIYSLGATIYHLAAGRPPFEGDAPTQIMMKHVNSPLVPLRSVNPDVPMELDDIIRRCMAKDPMDRYQDYADLISDLSHLKLQWMAREKGSMVASINDLKTVRLSPSEAAPASGAASASPAPAGRFLTEEPPEEEEHDNSLRNRLILGGVGAFVLAGIFLLFALPGSEPETPADGGERSGLAVLLDRLTGGAAPPEEDAPAGPEPDFLAWKETERILKDTGDALFAWEVERGRRAESLQELTDASYFVGDFRFSPDGVPLDGWGSRLMYSASDQTVISPGMDRRGRTEDDLTGDTDGNIMIRDSSVYEVLQERENQRRDTEG